MKKKFSWRQSFRDIPPLITTELNRIRSDIVVAAATKKIPISDITKGIYDHLGIRHDGAKTSVVTSIVPQRFVANSSHQ